MSQKSNAIVCFGLLFVYLFIIVLEIHSENCKSRFRCATELVRESKILCFTLFSGH